MFFLFLKAFKLCMVFIFVFSYDSFTFAQESKSKSHVKRQSFHGIDFKGISSLIDVYVQRDLQGNYNALNTSVKVYKDTDIRHIWGVYALRLAELRGEKKRHWKHSNIFEQPGYSAIEMLNHYLVSKGQPERVKFDYSGMSLNELIEVFLEYARIEEITDLQKLPVDSVSGAPLKIFSLWQHFGMKLATIRGDLKSDWKISNIFSKPGYSKAQLKADLMSLVYFKNKCGPVFK